MKLIAAGWGKIPPRTVKRKAMNAHVADGCFPYWKVAGRRFSNIKLAREFAMMEADRNDHRVALLYRKDSRCHEEIIERVPPTRDLYPELYREEAYA